MQDKDYLENDKEKDTPEGVIHTESTEQEEHDYERFCFLCRRPESQTGKLITLTDGISVCQRRKDRSPRLISGASRHPIS